MKKILEWQSFLKENLRLKFEISIKGGISINDKDAELFQKLFEVSKEEIEDILNDILDEGFMVTIETRTPSSEDVGFWNKNMFIINISKYFNRGANIFFERKIINNILPNIESHLNGHNLKIIYNSDRKNNGYRLDSRLTSVISLFIATKKIASEIRKEDSKHRNT